MTVVTVMLKEKRKDPSRQLLLGEIESTRAVFILWLRFILDFSI